MELRRKRRILVVDDDPLIRDMVPDLISDAGFESDVAESVDEAVRLVEANDFDLVLTDVQMPGKDGLELLRLVRELRPETPVVLMTGFGSIETAVKAIRSGALDYVTKPFGAETLMVAIERALEYRELQEENSRLRRVVARTASFGDLVGKSVAMNEIYALIRKISNNRSNVLITGESGTGKEVVARTIHLTGARADQPFVPINCTAMPEGLLESELFGHARGAFTGAHTAKKGLFEAANGGTIFLDEIGDMPLNSQSKLLRVLQDQEFRPVGANFSVKVDVRVIAATNQDLHKKIESGEFRKDLFYRLNVIPIVIPPLRERPEDIPPLATSFLAKHSGNDRMRLSEKAMRVLMQAPWEGNARELENCIERALVMAPPGEHEIKAGDISLPNESGYSGGGSSDLEETLVRLATEQHLSVKQLTDLYIDSTLEAVGGRKSAAAKLLGMNRRTLYRREERMARGAEAS